VAETALTGIFTDRRSQIVSLGFGFLIAGVCFALLLIAMTYLIRAVLCWGQPSWSRLVVPLLLLLISLRGLKRSLRRRAQSVRTY